MDGLEEALLEMIKGSRCVKKSSSNREPFAKVTVQGKKPGKAAVAKAIRSLSKEGRIRVVSHRFDTTYLPAARELGREDDVREVMSLHLHLAEIDMKILDDMAYASTVESLRDLDDLLAEFRRAAKGALKRKEDWG